MIEGFKHPIRNSRMNLGDVYFWTDTINGWKKLLKPDIYKTLIIDCLKELVDAKLIKIYAFVIMPNHLHIVWEMIAMNKKEMPHASFNKKTSHIIIKDLKANYQSVLLHFKVDDKERSYRVWQRDPLAILMDSREKLEQKIDYIHLNPLTERWDLAHSPEEYYWSSASFYETGEDRFGLLTHYLERF